MQGYSKGCFMCRRRKVKCDEEQPECTRCRRRGETCQYRDKNLWIFKSMNAQLAVKGSRAIPTTAASFPKSNPWERFPMQKLHSSLTIHQLTPDWEELATPYFFKYYVLLPNQCRRGYFDFLPGLFEQRGDDLALKHAVLAVAGSSFANVHNLTEVKIKAQTHYGLALRAIQHNLSDVESAKTDSSLASIVLLQLFDIVNGLKDRDGDHHDEALKQIQRLRTDEEQKTPTGRQLSFVIESRLRMNEFGVKKSHSRPTMQPCTVAPQAAVPAVNKIWEILGHISIINQQIDQVVTTNLLKNESSDVQLNTLAQQGFWIYTEINNMPSTLSEKDRYGNVPAKHLPSSLPIYPLVYHNFDSVQHAAIWIGFWSAEIQFLQNFRLLLAKLGTARAINTYSTTFLLEQANDRIIAAVDHICSSAPFMLGESSDGGSLAPRPGPSAVGAVFLLRGLYVATQVNTLTSDQRAFIFDKLCRIGHAKGILLALRCRDRWVDAQADAVPAS